MNKSIELKEKALQVIDFLVSNNACAIYPKTDELLGRVYRLAHAATDSECEHKDWERELIETYDKLKENGAI